MLQNELISNFCELGRFLSQFSVNNVTRRENVRNNDLFFDDFQELILLSQSHNGWFTPENVFFSIQSWSNALNEENLKKWLSAYDFNKVKSKTVALILAGNIPLVGFHDFLSVLISGHKVLIKTSSNDQKLLPFLVNYMMFLNPKLKDIISFTTERLANFDAIIATGNDNSARYFEFYFKDKPSIIRKNRNSVAVLTGNETTAQLQALGSDIFTYFGLGCRNVSKLFVPRNYDFKNFFEAMYKYKDVIYYPKYANNYDYNKAVFLMSNFKLLDNEFLTLKEDVSYGSPISSIFYEYYDDLSTIKTRLDLDQNKIQCLVSDDLFENSVKFGATQSPMLSDYADNVDTIEFLLSI